MELIREEQSKCKSDPELRERGLAGLVARKNEDSGTTRRRKALSKA